MDLYFNWDRRVVFYIYDFKHYDYKNCIHEAHKRSKDRIVIFFDENIICQTYLIQIKRSD